LDRAYTTETAIQHHPTGGEKKGKTEEQLAMAEWHQDHGTLGRNSRRSPETEDGGGKLFLAYALRGSKCLNTKQDKKLTSLNNSQLKKLALRKFSKIFLPTLVPNSNNLGVCFT
jgi:hypothetical protein